MQQIIGPPVADTPFRLQVTPAEAVFHSQWNRAKTAVLETVAAGGSAMVLSSPGSGKTLLLQDIARTLQAQGLSVCLINHGDALGQGLAADIVLVDEADTLNTEALATLGVRRNPFVLAALPGFTERLANFPRPVALVALEPLPPQEVARLVAARLSAAGRPRNLLEPEAVLALAQHSGGVPRLVNALAGAALLIADREGAPRVSRRHVEQAATLRDGASKASPARFAAKPPGDAAAPTAMAGSLDRQPAHRQRRAVVAGAAATVLALALFGVWVVQSPGLPGTHADRLTAGNPAQAQPAPTAQAATEAGAVGVGHDGATDRATALTAGVLRERDPAKGAGGSPELAAKPGPRLAAGALPMPGLFRGPIVNETMGKRGQVKLVISKQDEAGAIIARFDASAGLIGSGELVGRMFGNGRVIASGQLMMGANPFTCDLNGVISGDVMTGSASFVRRSGGQVAHSSFTLTRF